MTIKITEEKENKLFHRKEIKGTLESEITPNRANVLELLSKQFSVPIENIKIKIIKGNFGRNVFNIEANVYSSHEEKDLVELKKKKETPKGVAA
jgi:ribosomal protein S24E